MKYIRTERGKVWHEFISWYSYTFGTAWVKCSRHLLRVAELIDEHHLPEGAKLCKHCFPAKGKK